MSEFERIVPHPSGRGVPNFDEQIAELTRKVSADNAAKIERATEGLQRLLHDRGVTEGPHLFRSLFEGGAGVRTTAILRIEDVRKVGSVVLIAVNEETRNYDREDKFAPEMVLQMCGYAFFANSTASVCGARIVRTG